MSTHRAYTIAWARYGEYGFMLANTLSLTHRRGGHGRTCCGVEIPNRYDRRVELASAGRGTCRRCFPEGR